MGIILCAYLFAFSCSKNLNDSFSTGKIVYICKGAYSKSYHFDSECQGLRSCSTEIFEIEIESAQKKGRTLCGYEL
ncbi:hypothetical protein SAMN06296427_102122 [Moheibacter sediminis]|uniref:Uncharacterized protein n=1 Tax=Moheibacter sediminis TaxID=1434700 RepID=A0A1W1Z2X8_9FLAO|nr:hypothetical protein SAMN06296427_102122 [Moheibacter sediminis]